MCEGTDLVRLCGVTYLTLSAVTVSRLDTVLHLGRHPARHLLRSDGHLRVADDVLEGRHAAESPVQVVSAVRQHLIARAAFVQISLELSLAPPEEVDQYQ